MRYAEWCLTIEHSFPVMIQRECYCIHRFALMHFPLAITICILFANIGHIILSQKKNNHTHAEHFIFELLNITCYFPFNSIAFHFNCKCYTERYTWFSIFFSCIIYAMIDICTTIWWELHSEFQSTFAYTFIMGKNPISTKKKLNYH